MVERKVRRSPTLFPVAPIGVGTAAVESLNSYVARLALAHGVTAGQLIRYLYETGACDEMARTCGTGARAVRIDALSELVRPNRLSRLVVERLEALTGSRDLVRLTFTPLAGGLERCQSTFAEHTRWCPRCFRESELGGGPAYYQLIWQIRDVALCPIHYTALQERCAACGAHQDTRGWRHPAHLCQRCVTPLSGDGEKEAISEGAEAEAADLVELLEHYSDLSPEGVSGHWVRSVLDIFFDGYWACEREDELYSLFGGRDHWLGIVCGTRPMTLRTLRRTAYTLGVSLYDLMMGQLAQQPLGLGESAQTPRPAFMQVGRRKRYDRDKIVRRVRAVIDNAERPLALTDVAREVGVSTGYLRYQFPVLTRQIITAHKRYEDEQAQRQRHQAIQAILAYRTHKRDTGTKKMINRLHRRYGLSKYVLRRAWQDVRGRQPTNAPQR